MPLLVTSLTDKLSDLTTYFIALLEAAKTDLGILDVFYNDQDRIPRNPAVCVEPGSLTRELRGLPRMGRVELTITFIIYHNMVMDKQDAEMTNTLLAEAVELAVNQDPKLGGLVIDGMVTRVEHGYMAKNRGSVYRASLLTYVATSQVMLPYPPAT
jgi:hypothetical protein